MQWIVFDLEATCWDEQNVAESQETIEIGAIRLDDAFLPIGEFDRFIRPTMNPTLSAFCTTLTHIEQSDVARADTFPVVFQQFVDWIGPESYRITSWGDYDLGQFRQDCNRHAMKLPKRFTKTHLNLKELFATQRKTRPCGMKQALEMLHMPLIGTHHRAIDDARNISKIAKIILPSSSR